MPIVYEVKGKKFFYFLFDLFVVTAAYVFAYLLRFSPNIRQSVNYLHFRYFIVLIAAYLISFYFFQIYRIMWRYSNIKDVYNLVFANICSSAGSFVFMRLAGISFSRLILIMTFFLVLFGTVFYRVLIRDYLTRLKNVQKNNNREDNIIIIGAGEAGRGIISELTKQGRYNQIIGFIDDDEKKTNKILNGKRVIGTSKILTATIQKNKVAEVIIAIPSATSHQVNNILNILSADESKSDLKIKILPPMSEILSKSPLLQFLREVSITDLIGREEFSIDTPSIEQSFKNRTVLITGAGGSIGSELCRQILKYDIKKLIAVDRAEFSIYELVKNLKEYITCLSNKPEIVFKIADIRDDTLLGKIFNEYKPDVVFHAAAHKHVPLMEYNESEAIKNNVLGTARVLEISKQFNVEKFVFISTDKAVNPVSIMGASKRIAELITLYFCKEKGLKTTIVRFGNVIGSSGSVIPLFQEQIGNGGPVTVTHPDIKRFFMTIPEASILVINAASYSSGGEIFILDMGTQYKIVDIARNLIRFYGFEPQKDIDIVYTGLRPGEKLFEELYNEKEQLRKTKNKKIFILDTKDQFYNSDFIEKFMNNDLKNIMSYNSREIRKRVKALIRDYSFSDNKINVDFSKFIS